MKIEPVVGEVGRYFCQSGSEEHTRHLVDLLEDACGCADWTCRHRAHQAKFYAPYRCKHIVAVREFFLDEILETLKNEVTK